MEKSDNIPTFCEDDTPNSLLGKSTIRWLSMPCISTWHREVLITQTSSLYLNICKQTPQERLWMFRKDMLSVNLALIL